MATNYDVAIVGGGVIGTSIALDLTEKGFKVALIERNNIGSGASRAAIGGLTPQSDDFVKGELRQFALKSVDLYPRFLSKLNELTGMQVEYHDEGLLQVAFSELEMLKLEKLVKDWQAEGFECIKLSTKEILEREPLLNPAILDGYHLPGEPQVDTGMLMDALAKALSKLPCTPILGQSVVEVLESKSKVKGVKLDNGSIVLANWVIVSAGAWSDKIKGLPFCSLVPIKGQAFSVKMNPQRFTHHIYNSPVGLGEDTTKHMTYSAYLVPRLDGRVLAGVTYEIAGYDTRVTVEGFHTVLEACTRLAPELRYFEIIDSWAGLRPKASDGKPIIGKSAQIENLVFATGHYGLGITLAPVTAKIISDIIMGYPEKTELKDYSPNRFLA